MPRSVGQLVQGGAPVNRGRMGSADRLSLVAGVLFVVAGVLFLLDALEVWELRIDYLVPLGLIVVGLGVLASALPLRRGRS